MDLELKSRFNETSEIAKYNLRCNRNLSEKMTKKDFVYDIRRPLQSAKKIEVQKKKSVLVSQEKKRKTFLDASRGSEFLKNRTGGNLTVRLELERILSYKCNFCKERIATFSSLSTHVKFHCREYCKKCYWILEDGESMEKHFERRH